MVRGTLAAPEPLNRDCVRPSGGEWPRSKCSGTLIAGCRSAGRPCPPFCPSDAALPHPDVAPSSAMLLHTPEAGLKAFRLARLPCVAISSGETALRPNGCNAPEDDVRTGGNGSLLDVGREGSNGMLLTEVERVSHEARLLGEAASPALALLLLLLPAFCLLSCADMRTESRLFDLPLVCCSCQDGKYTSVLVPEQKQGFNTLES